MVCSIAAGLYLEHRNDVTTNSISTSEEQRRGGGGGGARHRTACVGSIRRPARSSFPFLGFGRCVLEVEDLLEPDRSLVDEQQPLQRRMTCRHHRLLWLGCGPLTRRLDVSILHGFCRSASALTCFEREEIANSVLFPVRWGPSGGSHYPGAVFPPGRGNCCRGGPTGPRVDNGNFAPAPRPAPPQTAGLGGPPGPKSALGRSPSCQRPPWGWWAWWLWLGALEQPVTGLYGPGVE